MKKVLRIFILILAGVFLLAWVFSWFAPKASKIEYGVTFSAPYARSLGLDPKQGYLAILDELKPKYVRLSAYWNEVEKIKDEFGFLTDKEDDLHFQISEAAKRKVKIVVAVGRRLPRWPECHDPAWLDGLGSREIENEQLSYVEAVVSKYQEERQIIAWQVENEPFLSTFGICPKLGTSFLDSEIALVKKLDPSRPVIITDSGELSLWVNSGRRGDIFGSTLYRYVYSDIFNRYWTNHIPPIYYRAKAGLLRLLNPGKPVVIMELEAEPWTTKGIISTPIDEQFKTMGMNQFNTILQIARDVGFSPQYLWGAEWWYWMKENNHPEFWDKAKELLKN